MPKIKNAISLGTLHTDTRGIFNKIQNKTLANKVLLIVAKNIFDIKHKR